MDQSGQAYRNGSDDVIDVNYVEKEKYIKNYWNGKMNVRGKKLY